MDTPLLLFHQNDYLAPKFSKFNTTVTLIEHQTATVSCDASGSPPPDVSWQRGGRLLPSYGSVRQSGNELHIDDVRVSDGGTYVCLAKNSAGTGVLGIRFNRPLYGSVQTWYERVQPCLYLFIIESRKFKTRTLKRIMWSIMKSRNVIIIARMKC